MAGNRESDFSGEKYIELHKVNSNILGGGVKKIIKSIENNTSESESLSGVEQGSQLHTTFHPVMHDDNLQHVSGVNDYLKSLYRWILDEQIKGEAGLKSLIDDEDFSTLKDVREIFCEIADALAKCNFDNEVISNIDFQVQEIKAILETVDQIEPDGIGISEMQSYPSIQEKIEKFIDFVEENYIVSEFEHLNNVKNKDGNLDKKIRLRNSISETDNLAKLLSTELKNFQPKSILKNSKMSDKLEERSSSSLKVGEPIDLRRIPEGKVRQMSDKLEERSSSNLRGSVLQKPIIQSVASQNVRNKG